MKLSPLPLASLLVAALLILPAYGWTRVDQALAAAPQSAFKSQSALEPQFALERRSEHEESPQLAVPVFESGNGQNHSPMAASAAALLVEEGSPPTSPADSEQMSRPRPRPSAPHAPVLAVGLNAASELKLPGVMLKTILPPASSAFPARLKTVPIVARSPSTETVAYLAEHEIRYPSQSIPYVALTFDCELGVESTRQILQTLRQEGDSEGPIRITFFIMGQYALKYPDVVREIVADGHELGNHSFDHPKFTSLTQVTATQQISYTEAAINLALGKPVSMRYFRFPYGLREMEHLTQIAELGYQSVFWNLDPRGWEEGKTTQDVVEYVRQTVRPGGIVVMHCGCWNDVNALPEIIRIVRDKGLKMGTISDIRNYAVSEIVFD
ncbi:MAG: polysaccharide deacetylase family protein [Anaerolineae bacterium]|nr:polysaccharide deacetylase family protein [Anaerolineae bacterium]